VHMQYALVVVKLSVAQNDNLSPSSLSLPFLELAKKMRGSKRCAPRVPSLGRGSAPTSCSSFRDLFLVGWKRQLFAGSLKPDGTQYLFPNHFIEVKTEHLQRETLERVAREMGVKQVCSEIVNSLRVISRKLVGRLVLNSTT